MCTFTICRLSHRRPVTIRRFNRSKPELGHSPPVPKLLCEVTETHWKFALKIGYILGQIHRRCFHLLRFQYQGWELNTIKPVL